MIHVRKLPQNRNLKAARRPEGEGERTEKPAETGGRSRRRSGLGSLSGAATEEDQQRQGKDETCPGRQDVDAAPVHQRGERGLVELRAPRNRDRDLRDQTIFPDDHVELDVDLQRASEVGRVRVWFRSEAAWMASSAR